MKPRPEYQLKLLKEESASEDLFDEKAHENIADTLFKVIRQGDEGITIGLEGEWGSGKSTVVSILKQRLLRSKETLYFYFDAWAHEGDPLRRVFLESLIKGIENNSLLENIKRRISNREKVTKTKSKKTITGLGKALSLATLLVPLGAALISGTAQEVTININSKPHWLFIAGLFFVLFPAWILLIHGFNLLINPQKRQEKELFSSSNWSFLQGETDSTETQEVSEDEERSSIEFERYFGEILDIVFSETKKSRLLIIVDNLDRIDARDSLKIWSTLQTFLQRKNPIEVTNAFYRKIWVLVPYDEEGLRRLWKTPTDKTSSASKSFFDKCFQLRIEVPKPTLTGWESFCRHSMEQALIGWSNQEREQVLEVLKLTRESVNHIPSPREIKTYINQVGLLRLHCGFDISIKSIAYFSVLKYLEFKSNKDIEDQLIKGRGYSNNFIFPPNLNRELCGILFRVGPDKGYQLLLEPAINAALEQRKPGDLKLLCDTHQSAFWIVFDIHVRLVARPDGSPQRAMRHSWTILNGLWKKHPEKCSRFIGHLKSFFSNHPRLEFPKAENLEEYKAAFILLEAGEYNFTQTWNSIVELLKSEILKNDFDFDFGNRAINILAECQKSHFPASHILDDIPIGKWITWAAVNEGEEYKSYKLIKPPKSLVSEIAREIKVNHPIPEALYELIKYIVKGGEKELSAIIEPIKNHINFNDGMPLNNTPSLPALYILTLLSTLNRETLNLISPIVGSYQFYRLTHNLKSMGSIKHSAFLMAKCLPFDKFYSLSFQNYPEANKGADENRKFWMEEGETVKDRAKFVWDLLKKDHDYGFIWKLATKKENRLVSATIKIAIDKDHSEFFEFKPALDNFSYAAQILDDDSYIEKLVKCFIHHSSIEQEISDNQNLDIIAFSKEIWLLIQNEDNKITKFVAVALEAVSTDEWKKAFNEKTHSISLAISIKKAIPDFELTNHYCDALEAFLVSWISGKVSLSESQENTLPEFISILQTSFQEHLRNRLTNYLIDTKFKGNSIVIEKLMDYVDIHKIFNSGKENLQEAIQGFTQHKDLQALAMINILLSHNKSASFNPHSYFPDVIRQPMIELIQSSDDINHKRLINELASKLGVDLTQPDSASDPESN